MSPMGVQERHLWLNLVEMKDVDKAHFLDAPISQAGLFGDTVEGFAQQFSAVQQQTEAIQHTAARGQASVCPSPWAPSCVLQSCSAPGRIDTLAGASSLSQESGAPPRPSQAPSHPGSQRSGLDAGNPEMLEFALSQETARTAPLLPLVEGREENLPFLFRRWSKGQRYPLSQERAISFSSGFSGPWDDSVRCPASSLSPTTHFASSQESKVRGRHSSPPKFNGVLETLVAVRNAPVLREEIAVLLAKDAIEPVPPAKRRQGFYSPYFIVPKKRGGLRPILDLRVLNRALHKLPF